MFLEIGFCRKPKLLVFSVLQRLFLSAVKPKKRRKVAPVAWIILFGDAFHKFIDGVSVGAAFTESFFAGISVALAVICEEIPHELGRVVFASGKHVRIIYTPLYLTFI